MTANIESIETWQVEADVQVEAARTGIIGELFGGCVELIKLLTAQSKLSNPPHECYDVFESSLAAIFFWGDVFGASRGDLDHALQDSEDLRDMTLSILIAIGELIIGGLPLVLSEKEDQADVLRSSHATSLLEKARSVLLEPEDPESLFPGSAAEFATTLRDRVGLLNGLNKTLERPATDHYDNERAKELGSLKDRSAHDYYEDLIVSRFPHAHQRLVEMLGQCNWKRYNYIQQQRANAADEVVVITGKDASSKFHDSGIGSSVPTQSEYGNTGPARSAYARTVVSTRAASSHKRLPRLPAEAKNGVPFTCGVCDRKVQLYSTRDYKDHVFRDLLAYVCIFDGCPSAGMMFEDFESISAHIGLQHGLAPSWDSQKCPLCLEQTGSSKIAVTLHFGRHLEEIALRALPHTVTQSDDDASSAHGSTSSSSSARTRHDQPDDSETVWDGDKTADERVSWMADGRSIVFSDDTTDGQEKNIKDDTSLGEHAELAGINTEAIGAQKVQPMGPPGDLVLEANNVMTDRLQAADRARSQFPTSSTSHGASPFKQGSLLAPPTVSPSSTKPRKTSFFPNNEWRRPVAPDEWWAVTEPEWDGMGPPMKMNWTHVGRIMETEEGEPVTEACEQCLAAGAATACWVYTREAMRRYGFKTYVCARCRATANVCSLNPFFRNSVGLRDSRPRPPPL